MSYAGHLKELLRPMGVYRLEGTINGGELESIGAALDIRANQLEEIQREMMITTAISTGLDAMEGLLSKKPLATGLERRRAALSALLRIGGDSFTLVAINDNLAGCGVNAVAEETGLPGRVEVHFPDVPGIPDRFEELCQIIEDILPCHLEINYVFWYVTWAMLEARFLTWGALEEGGFTWGEIEKLVRVENAT